MSLTFLVMLLPNVCNKIGQQLPQLLFILYRLVSFTKPLEASEDSPESPEEPPWPLGHRRESWDAAGTVSTPRSLILDASEDTFRAAAPRIDQLFTYLYGL